MIMAGAVMLLHMRSAEAEDRKFQEEKKKFRTENRRKGRKNK